MEGSWKPHPGPQTTFCELWQDEALYGGAAGGGKTDCLVMEALRDVARPGYKGLILRRTFPQLQEILDRTRIYYPHAGGEYRAGEHRWYFPSGAVIQLGHIQNDGDEYNYQGKEYQYLAFDEAGQFLPKQYLYLFSRLRSTDPSIKARIRAATNPGGPGHQFLKDRFRITNEIPGTTIRDSITGMYRVFVPARLSDNPSLALNDPAYVQRLMSLPEIERLRLMEGVWDAFEGQAYSELNRDIHGFDFEPPLEWERFGSFDWGYSRPWAYGLYAVDYDGRIYLYKLAYGCKTGEPNVGTRQSDPEIAREIRRLEEGEPRIRIRVADPSIWNRRTTKDGMLGPSPQENLIREGIVFVKADNDRKLGWAQVHHRLATEDGQPHLYIHVSLDDAWRTLHLMQEDPKNPEELLEKNVEDHIPDMLRYAVMTRPIRPKMTEPRDMPGTFRSERKKYLKAKMIAARHGISIQEAYGRRF